MIKPKRKKWTKAQKKKLKLYWQALKEAKSAYEAHVFFIEQAMKSDLKVPEIEFFWGVDGYCGIGNQWAKDSEKYGLILADKLESQS